MTPTRRKSGGENPEADPASSVPVEVASPAQLETGSLLPRLCTRHVDIARTGRRGSQETPWLLCRRDAALARVLFMTAVSLMPTMYPERRTGELSFNPSLCQ